MLRLKSILTIILLAVTTLVMAQKSYLIDSVCVGAERYYRIDGEEGSTYDWHITDTVTGAEITVTPAEGTPVTDTDTNGNPIWGNEISHFWTDEGIYRVTTYHYSEFGCDTLEQGLVRVYEGPEAFAGTGSTVCFTAPIALTDDDAQNYSTLEWTTLGDGTFDYTDQLHPVYTPGPGDSITGSVTLIITAYGLAENNSCIPAVDSVTYLFNNPEVSFTPGSLLCFGDGAGSVTAIVTNGIPPYTYSWSGPGGFSSASDAISGLTAGMYHLTVSDANGCTVTDSTEITEPEELLAEIEPSGNVSCFGGNDGFAEVTTSGGTGIISYEWNTTPLQTTATATNLTAGEYVVTVTDENGCTAKDTVVITEPDELLTSVDSIKNVNCFGGNDGAARVLVAGGSGPYSFEWNTVPVQTNATAVNLTAGEYIVSVTDSNGCVAFDTVHITEPLPLVLAADSLDSRCGGNSPGEIDLTVTGGTPFTTAPHYLYEWHDSTGVIANTEDITGLAGDKLYRVYVTDSLGCTDSLEMYINDEKNIKLTALVDPIDCYGTSTGAIDISVQSGKKPYTYSWDSGETVEDLTNLPAGFYRVTVNDANLCDETLEFTLEDPEELVVNITPDTTELCMGGSLALNGNPTGGTGTISHLWSGTGAVYLDATNVVNPLFAGAPEGTYEIIYTATDSMGCVDSDTLNLIVNPVLTSVTDTFICAAELPLIWNDSTFVAFGTYTNSTKNIYGCDSVMTLNIYEIPATTSTYDTLVCAGELPVVWHDSTYTAFGTYTNVIDNAEGCDSVITFTIIESPATTGTYDTLLCAGEFPVVWHDSTYTAFGTYTNVIDNAEGCDSVITFTIIESPATTSTYDTLLCAGELPVVWHDSTYTAFGTYTNVIDNAEGCDSVITFTIIESPATTSTYDTLLCAGEFPVVWHDSTYTAFGTYTNVIDNVEGCDSVITFTIIESPATTSTYDTLLCAGEFPVVWHDSTYTAFGTYTNVIDNFEGCDSIITFTIIEAPATTSTYDTLLCAGEFPVVWHDSTYTAFGTYTNVIDNAEGCDSVITFTIIESPATTSTFDTLMCAGELPLVWNDSTYTVSERIQIQLIMRMAAIQ